MTTITIDRALLEQSLDALECCYSQEYDGAKIHGAKAALRAALAAQPASAEQAPASPAYSKTIAAQPSGPAWQDAPDEREAFEAFISAPPFELSTVRFDDRGAWPGAYKSYDADLAWKAWQAACAWQRKEREPIDAMTEVADRFAHRMALVLECVLMGNSSDRWWNDGHKLIGEYRSAMNAIHERESPTFMGEPVLRECADKIRSGA